MVLIQRFSECTRGFSNKGVGAIAIALTLLFVSLVVAARTHAYDPVTNTIGRANLDGSGVNQSFISGAGNPGGVAVDANHIYWASHATDTIARAILDGSVNQSFIAALSPVDVAVDSAHVFWTNDSYPMYTLGRANLDGTGVNQGFIAGLDAPVGVAVDAAHVYWVNYIGDTIGRAELDGTNVDESFIDGGTGFYPYHLAVDTNHVYWTNLGTETIGRANLDGTNPNPSFISGANSSFGVAVDADHVYWTAHTGAIGRANLDGTNVDRSFVTGAGFPNDVAVDANHIYWTNGSPPPSLPCGSPCAIPDTVPPKTKITKGAPNKTKKRKLRFKFKSSEPGSSFECKRDKRKWKPCESPKRLKNLDPGKHRFRVRAIDTAGNVDPTPAKDKFKVIA